jgi:hypothetical protein
MADESPERRPILPHQMPEAYGVVAIAAEGIVDLLHVDRTVWQKGA